MKNARGFTLVELLVAITVLAIVAVMGWRGLDGIVRSREKLTHQMEETRGIQLAFSQLQSDLEQIADKPLLREHQNILADNSRLVFVRTVLAENAPSALQVVSYRIRDGVLSRRESATTRDLVQLDGLWQAALNDSGDDGVALQGNVGGMTVRVWEAGGWKLPENSSTSFAAQQQPCPDLTSPACLNPQIPLPGQPVKPANEGPTGLEISLQVQGQPAVLTKVFLLGAV